MPRQHPWLVPLARLFAKPLFFLLGPLVVSGAYRVPRKGGLLVLANHQADIDPAVVQAACPRRVYFMAKSELFEMRAVGKAIRWFRAFPVKRGEPDRTAIKTAAAYAKAGEAVGIFPEGQLSEDGELQPLKAGAALIVRMAGAPVICLGLRDTNRILPFGKLIPRPAFRRVYARWGEVRTFTKDDSAETILGWIEGQFRELTEAGGA